MNDDIIRMAREVWPRAVLPFPELERFAALVAAAAKAQELEACAAVARQWDVDHPTSNYGRCIANLILTKQSL